MTEFMRDCPNASPPMCGRMLSLSYCSEPQSELRAASLTKLERPRDNKSAHKRGCASIISGIKCHITNS